VFGNGRSPGPETRAGAEVAECERLTTFYAEFAARQRNGPAACNVCGYDGSGSTHLLKRPSHLDLPDVYSCVTRTTSPHRSGAIGRLFTRSSNIDAGCLQQRQGVARLHDARPEPVVERHLSVDELVGE